MILAVIASAMAVMFVLHAETDSSSAEVTESGWCGETAYYYIYSDGTLQICGSGEMYNYAGFTHAPWYEHCGDITKIVIGDEITKLGASAFIGMKFVKELTMPITINSVVSDQFPAFAGCYKIEKINFTCGKGGYGFDYAACGGNNSWYQLTPWYQSNDYLKEVNFADGVKHIGADAFRELNITSVVLPDSVTSLGCHCFFNCTKLTDLTVPVSLKSYGDWKYPAFIGCSDIAKVTITRGNGEPYDYSDVYGWPNGANLLPWNINSDVAKTIVISDNVTSLGKYTFFFCNIKEITIPISLECGDSKVFYADGSDYNSLEKVTFTKGNGSGCDYYWDTYNFNPWNSAPNLKTIVVEDGVTGIGNYTFYTCNVDTIILPNSLNALGSNTFGECTVKDLTIPISLNATWLDRLDSGSAFQDVSGIVKVTFTPGTGYGYDYAAYEVHNSWYKMTPWYQCRDTLKEIVFEDGIRHIGSDAFRELNITSLVIPDSVESLGCHTFYNCGELTDVTVPISLDCAGSAKYSAFEGCTSIASLKFTAGTGIGVDYTVDYHPAWCTPGFNVAQISFDSGITYIGTHAFDQYLFTGKNGVLLQYSAADLSGHVFIRNGALMCISDVSDEMDQAGCGSDVPAITLIFTWRW